MPPRRYSDDDEIIWKAIAIVTAFLIILGAIIAFAKVAWILFLIISIILLASWYFSREDILFNLGIASLIICLVFLIIAFVIGGSELGKTAQEFYSLAVNISRIRLTP